MNRLRRCGLLLFALMTASVRASDPCTDALGDLAGAKVGPTLVRAAAVVPGRPSDTIATRPAAPYAVEVALALNSDNVGTVVNGVLVTRGGYAGLLAVTMMPILQHMPAPSLQDWTPYRGKKVLLVGEGLDPRVEQAARAGVDVRAMDLWYDAAFIADIEGHVDRHATMREQRDLQFLIDHYRRHQKHLVAGSVLDIPYADGSLDVVLTSRLLNNLNATDQLTALREMCRVVAVGGHVETKPSDMHKGNIDKLRAELGDRFRIEENRITRLR